MVLSFQLLPQLQTNVCAVIKDRYVNYFLNILNKIHLSKNLSEQ